MLEEWLNDYGEVTTFSFNIYTYYEGSVYHDNQRVPFLI